MKEVVITGHASSKRPDSIGYFIPERQYRAEDWTNFGDLPLIHVPGEGAQRKLEIDAIEVAKILEDIGVTKTSSHIVLEIRACGCTGFALNLFKELDDTSRITISTYDGNYVANEEGKLLSLIEVIDDIRFFKSFGGVEMSKLDTVELFYDRELILKKYPSWQVISDIKPNGGKTHKIIPYGYSFTIITNDPGNPDNIITKRVRTYRVELESITFNPLDKNSTRMSLKELIGCCLIRCCC